MNNKNKKAGANINLTGHRCYRCGHEWIPREKGDIPRVCPKCKSPYWDRPKRINKNEKFDKGK